MKKTIAMLALSLLWAGPATALDLQCVAYRSFANERAVQRPDVPDCLTASGAFADPSEHDQCLGRLQQYQKDLQSYLNCLESESREAIAEFDQILAGFRARAALKIPQ